MAYIKISSFRKAEEDCTEALKLDSEYFKVYGRKALARKELRNLKGSMEDIEYALKLERKNQEMIKQHAAIKSLLEKV
ncbi:hypothetical protein BVRB_8g191420 [Beta vulgaris subsp. vulgaris]|nr:hypothetical protein BVRB_8g191420 [Beta vulgaris subsp. vulgaris]